ncbi:MAG: acyl CoA:acetate/3-ketoacid CoA transferase beta subunit [Myxococcota bacterium]|jgi:acyl CoA:acetate/3-ketoacid CoA transferase beta subunit
MISREEYCVVACAEAFRGDGEIMVSPMGAVPKRAALLARATFAPDILLTDGVAGLVCDEGLEGWMPYRRVFETLWAGRRHVMMGASQLDAHGNTNISCVGDWAKPKVQLLGVRGGPGNTINHTTSYFIPRHNKKVFVERVDMVSGLGADRAAALGEGGRFFEIRRVVSDLGVFVLRDSRLSVLSLHPGVELAEVVEKTGFEVGVSGEVPVTRDPTEAELAILRA